MCYFQDIPVEGHDSEARTVWDDWSNRVLIREEFAENLGLVKKEIKYSLEAVGQETVYTVQDWVHLHAESCGHV